MMVRVNLALMETVSAQRASQREQGRAGRPVLHPMAEYHGDWERERERKPADGIDRTFEISLKRDDA